MTTIRLSEDEAFRIPVPYSDGEIVVYLYPDVAALNAALSDYGVDVEQPYIGLYSDVVPADQNDALVADVVGVLCLARDHMGSGLVAHELAHAAFRTLERERLKLRHWHQRKPFWARVLWWYDVVARSNDVEERYCMTLERLTRSFWEEWFAHGYDAE